MFLLLLLVFGALSPSESHVRSSCGLVHTWHNVTAVKGMWEATLTSLHENMTFVRPLDQHHLNCTTYAKPRGHFSIGNGTLGQFGFVPNLKDDFNVMYALTLLRTDKEFDVRLPRKTMGCCFVIGAAGAAEPDIRPEPYNGATCWWTRVQGVGENYFVDFAAP